MKKTILLSFFAVAALFACDSAKKIPSADTATVKGQVMETAKEAVETVSVSMDNSKTMDTLSYSVGVLVAQNLKSQGLEELDAATLADAVNDVLAGNELKIPFEEAGNNFQTYMQAQSEKMNAGAIAGGKAFLVENGKKAGVVTTASGLQYEIMTAGAGASPQSSDKVTVHYEGSLTDGTVFDSSYKRGNPATFGVTQVIPGWVEALQLMQPGAKWKLTIPQDLAYGERGAPPNIPPFSTLIFTVEMIEIAK